MEHNETTITHHTCIFRRRKRTSSDSLWSLRRRGAAGRWRALTERYHQTTPVTTEYKSTRTEIWRIKSVTVRKEIKWLKLWLRVSFVNNESTRPCASRLMGVNLHFWSRMKNTGFVFHVFVSPLYLFCSWILFIVDGHQLRVLSVLVSIGPAHAVYHHLNTQADSVSPLSFHKALQKVSF